MCGRQEPTPCGAASAILPTVPSLRSPLILHSKRAVEAGQSSRWSPTLALTCRRSHVACRPLPPHTRPRTGDHGSERVVTAFALYGAWCRKLPAVAIYLRQHRSRQCPVRALLHLVHAFTALRLPLSVSAPPASQRCAGRSAFRHQRARRMAPQRTRLPAAVVCSTAFQRRTALPSSQRSRQRLATAAPKVIRCLASRAT